MHHELSLKFSTLTSLLQDYSPRIPLFYGGPRMRESF